CDVPELVLSPAKSRGFEPTDAAVYLEFIAVDPETVSAPQHQAIAPRPAGRLDVRQADEWVSVCGDGEQQGVVRLLCQDNPLEVDGGSTGEKVDVPGTGWPGDAGRQRRALVVVLADGFGRGFADLFQAGSVFHGSSRPVGVSVASGKCRANSLSRTR